MICRPRRLSWRISHSFTRYLRVHTDVLDPRHSFDTDNSTGHEVNKPSRLYIYIGLIHGCTVSLLLNIKGIHIADGRLSSTIVGYSTLSSESQAKNALLNARTSLCHDSAACLHSTDRIQLKNT